MAKKKDREGLFDPKHYWARRVKAKYTRRGGKSQYPAKVGDWTMDESWYDAIAHGNRAYETESASFDHPLGDHTAIYHSSGPKGETWRLQGGESYDSLKDALAALKGSGGRKRKAAPKKRKTRKAAPSKSRRSAAKSSRTAADYFSMGSADLLALGDAGAKKELKRRGRDPRTGKKVRR